MREWIISGDKGTAVQGEMLTRLSALLGVPAAAIRPRLEALLYDEAAFINELAPFEAKTAAGQDAAAKEAALKGVLEEQYVAKASKAANNIRIFDRFAALLGALELTPAAIAAAAAADADADATAPAAGGLPRSTVASCTEGLVDALGLRGRGQYGSMTDQESAVQACFGKVLTVVEERDSIWTKNLMRAMGVKKINAYIVPGQCV